LNSVIPLFFRPAQQVTTVCGELSAPPSLRDGISDKVSACLRDRTVRRLPPLERCGQRPKATSCSLPKAPNPSETSFWPRNPGVACHAATQSYPPRISRKRRHRVREHARANSRDQSAASIHARRHRSKMCGALAEFRPGTSGITACQIRPAPVRMRESIHPLLYVPASQFQPSTRLHLTHTKSRFPHLVILIHESRSREPCL
jgi:hypothetical protein